MAIRRECDYSLLLLGKEGRDFLQRFDAEFLDSFLKKEVPIIWERAEKKVTGETDREYQENVKKVKESIVTGLASFAGGKSFVEKHPYLQAYLPKKEEEQAESKGHAGKRKRGEDYPGQNVLTNSEENHPYPGQGVSASTLASSMMPAISSSTQQMEVDHNSGNGQTPQGSEQLTSHKKPKAEKSSSSSSSSIESPRTSHGPSPG